MYNVVAMDTAHILKLIGIDFCRLRDAQPEAGSSGRRQAPVEALEAPARVDVNPSSREEVVPVLIEQSPPRIAPFTVLCLLFDQLLLLVESSNPRTARRFALDLHAALSGHWQVDAQQLSFSWPQAGIENSATHAQRALAAFLDKQIGDAGEAQILVCEGVVRKSPELSWPDQTIVVAELDKLMSDGDLKRSLWTQLVAVRR